MIQKLVAKMKKPEELTNDELTNDLDNLYKLDSLYKEVAPAASRVENAARHSAVLQEIRRRLRDGPPPPPLEKFKPEAMSTTMLIEAVSKRLSPFWKQWPPTARQYLGDLINEVTDRLEREPKETGEEGVEDEVVAPMNVGVCVQKGIDAMVQGVAAGFVQVEEFSSGKTYQAPWLNECYDMGVNLGQFLGRTTQLPKALRKKGREKLEDLEEYERIEHIKLLDDAPEDQNDDD